MRSRTFAVPLVIALSLACFGLWVQGAVPDVPTGQWLAGPPLAQPRTGAVGVALDDGRVLVIGGRTADGPVDTVEVYGLNGSLSVGPHLVVPRVGHAAARLADGRVLVAGGNTLVTTDTETAEAPTNSVEIFDPLGNVWYDAGPLSIARSGHSATATADGHVLIAGGIGGNGAALDSFEVFHPEAGTFSSAGLLSAARTEHAAAVAGDTKVLVAGGRNADGVLNTADLIDVETGTVSGVTLTAPRVGASATTLLDGRILVAGGSDGSNDLASAEVVDPVTALSAVTGSMSQPRRGHHALLLDHNATVLVVGGTNGGALLTGAQQFIPWTGTFSTTGSPASPRTSAILSSLSKKAGVAWFAAGRASGSALVGETELYGFATLNTDKDDYYPGQTVYVSGRGWQPGETVTLGLLEMPQEHESRSFAVQADDAGVIANQPLFLVEEHHLGVRFYLTARGAASQAQRTFTDAINNASVEIRNGTCATPTNDVFVPSGTTTTCARAATQGGGSNTFFVVWFRPDATIARNVNYQVGPGNNSTDDTFAVTPAYGQWTVKLCSTTNCAGGGNVIHATASFDVWRGRLAFTSNPLPIDVGQCSGPIQVQSQNGDTGAALAVSGTTPVALSATVGALYSNSGCTTLTASVQINNNQNTSQTFYFKSPTSAGTTINASASSYKPVAVTGTVNQATVAGTSISNVSGSGTYGTTATLTATLTSSGSGVTGKSIAFTLNGTSVGSATTDASGIATLPGISLTGINAGTFTNAVGASFAGDSSYGTSSGTGTLTVNKANQTITFGALANKAYGDAPFTVSATASSGLTVSFAASGNCTVSGTTVTITGAGSCTITASQIGDGNYNAAPPVPRTFSIAKASATILVTGFTGIYDGTAHGATGSATGVLGETLSGLDLGASFTNVPGGTASWTFTDVTGNYNNASGSAAIVISKANATVDVSGYTGGYDGLAHGASGTATGVGGAPLSGLDLGASFTNVPGGTASWTFTDATGNYNNASGSAPIVIAKASSATTVTFEAGPHVFRGTAFTATGAVTGAGELNQSVPLVYSGDCTNVTSADGCTATATFDGDANHEGSSDTKSVTITKASSTTTVSFEPGPYVFRGSAFTATATVTGAGGLNQSPAVPYSGDCLNVTGSNGCTAAANYPGDPNHDGSSDSKSITIAKANATIAVNGFTGTFDGNPHGATGSATGVGGADLSSLLSLGATFTNVPGGSADWTFNAGYANNNYDAASGSAPITIGQASLTVHVTAANVVFTGSPYAGPTTCTADGVNAEHPATSLKYVGTGATTYALSSTPPTAVGAYNAVCSAGGAGTNYVGASQSAPFSIGAWSLTGFYQPVTMGGVYNTVKGGSTVPLKFNVYQGTTERTDVAAVKRFVTQAVGCSGGVPEDPVEIVTTGGTSLRYDTTARQFVQNWQTSKPAGVCYVVTMTTQDDSTVIAYFKTK
jgi:hypothetical protein